MRVCMCMCVYACVRACVHVPTLTSTILRLGSLSRIITLLLTPAFDKRSHMLSALKFCVHTHTHIHTHREIQPCLLVKMPSYGRPAAEQGTNACPVSSKLGMRAKALLASTQGPHARQHDNHDSMCRTCREAYLGGYEQHSRGRVINLFGRRIES